MKDRVVYKYDAYCELEHLIGEDLVANRNVLYRLLSASNTDNRVYQIMFEKAYIDYDKFRFYVDSKYLFKLPNDDFLSCVIRPLRNIVDTALSTAHERIGGKFLMMTHDYVYFAFVNELEFIPKGCTKID